MRPCPYCRTLNATEAERCSRCGHWPSTSVTAHATSGSAAPAMHLVPDAPPPVREAAAAQAWLVAQTSLFRDAAPTQRVIPIPTLTPLRIAEQERPPRRGGGRTGQQVRPRRVSEAQQALDWGHAAPSQASLDEKISCSAPVASRARRLASTAVDGGAVLIGTAIIVSLYVWQGGEIKFGSGSMTMLGILLGIVSAVYRALWCMAAGDTPGMQFAGLHLVDFDGRHPSRRQRTIRQIASILSFCAAGVGIVWAMVDDEGLTWHDHISKTFPTAIQRHSA